MRIKNRELNREREVKAAVIKVGFKKTQLKQLYIFSTLLWKLLCVV